MSNRNPVLWLSLVVLSLAIGIRAEDKKDKENCSNATLRGSYGFHATGHVFAAVARSHSTGKAVLRERCTEEPPATHSGLSNLQGPIRDCIVTDTWLDSTHVSMIVDGGKGYFILNTTPSSADEDTVNSGEARRQ